MLSIMFSKVFLLFTCISNIKTFFKSFEFSLKFSVFIIMWIFCTTIFSRHSYNDIQEARCDENGVEQSETFFSKCLLYPAWPLIYILGLGQNHSTLIMHRTAYSLQSKKNKSCYTHFVSYLSHRFKGCLVFEESLLCAQSIPVPWLSHINTATHLRACQPKSADVQTWAYW
jgi:hypothetical protein